MNGDYFAGSNVQATPGGAAGDGSMAGNLTLQSATADASLVSKDIIKAGSAKHPVLRIASNSEVQLMANDILGTVGLSDKDGNDGVGVDLISVSFYKPIFRGTISTASSAGIALVGAGVPLVVAGGRFTGLTAGKTVCSYTTDSTADEVIEVGGVIYISTLGSANFTVQISYTSADSGSAITDVLNMSGGNGSIVTVPSIATDRYGILVRTIRAKANTTVSIITTGTFTGCTYNASGYLKVIGDSTGGI